MGNSWFGGTQSPFEGEVRTLTGDGTRGLVNTTTGATSRFQFLEGLVWWNNELIAADSRTLRLIHPQTGGSKHLYSHDSNLLSLCVDPSNNSLLVTDETRVFRFTVSALSPANDKPQPLVCSAVAGHAMEAKFADGDALVEARFNHPRLIHCASDGHEIVVADTENHRIRRIDTILQTVSTIAGDGKQQNTDGPALSNSVDLMCGAVADPWHIGAGRPDVLFAATNSIRRLNRRTGQLSTLQFLAVGLQPIDLIATPSGWLLMTCSATHSLYAVHPISGQTGRLAGTGGEGAAEGKALHGAAFRWPWRLALHPDPKQARVFVAENYRIRSVTISPYFLVPFFKPVEVPTTPLPPFAVSIDSTAVVVKRLVGVGASKRVWAAEWKLTPCAKLQLIASESVQAREAFESELKTLAELRHPNIVQLLGRVMGELSFVCELCEGGTLYHALYGSSKLSSAPNANNPSDAKSLVLKATPSASTATVAATVPPSSGGSAGSPVIASASAMPVPAPSPAGVSRVQRWHWARDAARAVAYLHSLSPPIVHRDIKSGNFLLTAEGRLKLTDFGFARLQLLSAGLSKQHSAVGTFAWQSPEAWDDDTAQYMAVASAGTAAAAALPAAVTMSTKSDVYSLGCVLLELFGGVAPWRGFTPKQIYFLVAVKGFQPPELDALASDPSDSTAVAIKVLISRCLERDPTKRPPAKEVLRTIEWIGAAFLATSPAAYALASAEQRATSLKLQNDQLLAQAQELSNALTVAKRKAAADAKAATDAARASGAAVAAAVKSHVTAVLSSHLQVLLSEIKEPINDLTELMSAVAQEIARAGPSASTCPKSSAAAAAAASASSARKTDGARPPVSLPPCMTDWTTSDVHVWLLWFNSRFAAEYAERVFDAFCVNGVALVQDVNAAWIDATIDQIAWRGPFARALTDAKQRYPPQTALAIAPPTTETSTNPNPSEQAIACKK